MLAAVAIVIVGAKSSGSPIRVNAGECPEGGGAMFSGARRVLRFLLIALMPALFAGTAAADKEFFVCGETFVTVTLADDKAKDATMSIRRSDIRLVIGGQGNEGNEEVGGIVVFTRPSAVSGEEGLPISRETWLMLVSCVS